MTSFEAPDARIRILIERLLCFDAELPVLRSPLESHDSVRIK